MAERKWWKKDEVAQPAAPASGVDALTRSMVDQVPVNVMYCDNELVIRYMNAASRRTFQKLAHLLPVAVDQMVGSSIDVFHRNPAHQRRILGDARSFPHHARFSLGPETLDFEAMAVTDPTGARVGTMVTWSLVTDRVHTATQVTEAATGVAGAIEQMRASIGEIARSSSHAASVAGQASHEAAEAHEVMSRLGDASNQIGKVVELISSVADETNLLALNATIEAARAGDAGRGFAVVAAEVKNLAEETARATEDIRSRIETIQRESQLAVGAIDRVLEVVQDVRDSASSIAAAVEEQTAVVEDIGRAAQRAADIVSVDHR